MKALYIGYCKTGTKTMNAVFKKLGYKCYDLEENFFFLGKEWKNIMEDGGSAEDFFRIYKDVDAAVDSPVYFFWEQIMEAFPDVKLLVSFRDEKDWLQSVLNQATALANDISFKAMIMLSPTGQNLARFMRTNCNRKWGADRNAWPWQISSGINPTLALNDYREHNAYIRQRALELGDQLHVVNYKDGWEPICEFLGEPIPDEPFPHENKGGNVMKNYAGSSTVFAMMQREMKITAAIVSVLCSVLIYFAIFL